MNNIRFYFFTDNLNEFIIKNIYKFKNIETTRTVNSFHNFSLQKLPKSFKEIGSSHDGEIEAILNEKLLTCGVMWHPEREKMINKKDIQLIKYLICLSKQKS